MGYTYTSINLRLNDVTDADILEYLKTKKKQTFIKRLIRDHMREEGFTVKGVY